VYAALFLITSLLGVAGIYLLLSVEFLALVQILVYGGAVMVLIIFALMLTRGDLRTAPMSSALAALAAGAAGRVHRHVEPDGGSDGRPDDRVVHGDRRGVPAGPRREIASSAAGGAGRRCAIASRRG
jgi:hypothetical protein